MNVSTPDLHNHTAELASANIINPDFLQSTAHTSQDSTSALGATAGNVLGPEGMDLLAPEYRDTLMSMSAANKSGSSPSLWNPDFLYGSVRTSQESASAFGTTASNVSRPVPMGLLAPEYQDTLMPMLAATTGGSDPS